MSTAERIRAKGRVTVLFPMLQESVEFRTYSIAHMLETGIGGKILDFVEESANAEEDAKRILQENKDIVIACSIEPKITYEETKHPGCLCINDIPDEDIVYAFKQIVFESSSRFFGVNRTAFGVNPEAYARVIDNQMTICYQVDLILSRWGNETYDDLMAWPSWKLTEAVSIIEGAEAFIKAHPPKKKDD